MGVVRGRVRGKSEREVVSLMIGGSVMELEIYQTGSDVFFLLRGRVVLEECDRLKSTCIPLINKGLEQVIVDLSKVDYIDSAGLGVLVGLKMTASKNKARIVLLHPSRSVSDILYISKLDGIFDIMTGSEAELLRAQIAQPENLAPSGGAAPAAVAASTGVTEGDTEPRAGAKPARDDAGGRSGVASLDIHPASASAGMGGDSEPDLRERLEEHCRRAVEFMRQGSYESSVEEYQKALALDPEYLPALNNLAIVYEKQPSWVPKAIEQWETVLRLSRARNDQKHVDRAERHLASLRKMES